ncbi:2-acyl-1-lysophosphatidylinositol acyltransferase [Monosporozyma unispora]|nr:hypothetical protein C6P44_000379 [Kazachstania unispora]
MVAKVFQKFNHLIISLVSIGVFIESAIVLCSIQVATKLAFQKNTKWYQKCMDSTKNYFIMIVTAILSIAAPSKVRITTCDDSIAKGRFLMDSQKGRISSTLRPNVVVICNHQIYTDWIYLWWVAYTSDFAGRVHIMLKKSLRSIPLLGFGMSNFNFLFMNRKWADDRINLLNTLKELDANARGLGPLAGKNPINVDEEGVAIWDCKSQPTIEEKTASSKCWPYTFLLFPEGTNLTDNTRSKTLKYANKVNKKPFRHLLLPHVTGLLFTLETLEPSIDVIYDVTIGYSGVGRSSYAASKYSLKQIFIEGKYPKLVDIHLRAYKVKDIPLKDEEKFSEWLYNVWAEKDDLLEEYYTTGSFTEDSTKATTVVDKFNIRTCEFLLVALVPSITLLFFLRWLYFF